MGHSNGTKCTSSFDVRIGTFDDIQAMADLAVRQGYDRRPFTLACERLLREVYGFSLVVTCNPPGERMVAFENATLLRPHAGTKIRCGGVPFSELLLDERERLIANEGEIGRANGDSGVDLFVAHFIIDHELATKERERAISTLASGFVERYVGNHVRSVLHELRGAEAAQAATYGGWEVAATYEEWGERSGRAQESCPILVRNDSASAVRHHNFLVARMLNYRPPTLMLPPAAREVVRCAYLGWSDTRIVTDLGLTTASLNSRWTRILDIAERRAPEIFANGTGGRVRDRHRLLAYIRNHPEEMWPYEPQRKG